MAGEKNNKEREAAATLLLMREDGRLRDMMHAIALFYRHKLPVSVNVNYDATVVVRHNEVDSILIDQCRHNIHAHIRTFYPDVADRLLAPANAVSHTSDDWIYTNERLPEPGVFLIVSEDGSLFCEKAFHYGNNEWQLTHPREEIKVKCYQPLPPPPPGMTYQI